MPLFSFLCQPYRESSYNINIRDLLRNLAVFIKFLLLNVLPACLYHVHAVPVDARRGHQIPLELELQLSSAILVLGSELNSKKSSRQGLFIAEP